MSSFNMEQTVSSSSSVDGLNVDQPQPTAAMPNQPVREKTKRPQLSCNPCRTRKVKCDRIQPCTACSLHQVADCCVYDLSAGERHPILQAEALKDRDKEIVRLRAEIERLGGPAIKMEASGSQDSSNGLMNLPPRVPKKPAKLRQQRLHRGEIIDSIYFGAPGLASVIDEFANLSVRKMAGNLAHGVPRGTDIFAFQMGSSHPFPTVWPQSGGTTVLLQVLPETKEEIFSYIDAFQKRAQSCSFPHMPDECTKKEIERFLEDPEHNANTHPDMLALLFATMALGLHNGVYDICGEKWIAGAMDAETQKGDVFIAAAMQALRVGSFMNRPSLLAVETLVMICPYLTNSGRFLDAWALFGVTVRLAQSIGLHRDPSRLNPPAPLQEVMARKNLWWWMLHMDQQYSMTLGRPLGISSIGDCPPPDTLMQAPVIQSLSNYINQFSILGRQILSAGDLSNNQIDDFTDQLLNLKITLPDLIKFDSHWLAPEKELPPWPLDAMAAVFHGKTHNYLVLLNRQRLENVDRHSVGSGDPAVNGPAGIRMDSDTEKIPRGRERVLESCRALLQAFSFFHSRVQVAMICWTMGQQAFNAAMILTLAMLETNEEENQQNDLAAIRRALDIFVEMNKLGIHKLAGAAVEKLGDLMKELNQGESTKEEVMSMQGMMLLEDPGLQGFMPGGFSPLSFQMAGGAIPHTGNRGTGWAATGVARGKNKATAGSSKQGGGDMAPPATQGVKKRVQQRRATLDDGSGNTTTGIIKPRVPNKKAIVRDRVQKVATSQRRSSEYLPATTNKSITAPVSPSSSAVPTFNQGESISIFGGFPPAASQTQVPGYFNQDPAQLPSQVRDLQTQQPSLGGLGTQNNAPSQYASFPELSTAEYTYEPTMAPMTDADFAAIMPQSLHNMYDVPGSSAGSQPQSAQSLPPSWGFHDPASNVDNGLSAGYNPQDQDEMAEWGFEGQGTSQRKRQFDFGFRAI